MRVFLRHLDKYFGNIKLYIIFSLHLKSNYMKSCTIYYYIFTFKNYNN